MLIVRIFGVNARMDIIVKRLDYCLNRRDYLLKQLDNQGHWLD
ncbi:hypothetical protein [Rossellomorea sp. NPDC077527]